MHFEGNREFETINSVKNKLEKLLKEEPIAYYELVVACKNPNYIPFGSSCSVLYNAGFRDHSGKIHKLVKRIILPF